MANEYTVEQVDEINADDIIEQASVKELVNFEFNDNPENIARTHKIVQVLLQKVLELERKVKSLEERK